MKSDPGFLLAEALEVGWETFSSRLTIVANGSTIKKVLFPVDDPQNRAAEIVGPLGTTSSQRPSQNALEST
jgi:hypothetical protein